jgi:hypothetical protein
MRSARPLALLGSMVLANASLLFTFSRSAEDAPDRRRALWLLDAGIRDAAGDDACDGCSRPQEAGVSDGGYEDSGVVPLVGQDR